MIRLALFAAFALTGACNSAAQTSPSNPAPSHGDNASLLLPRTAANWWSQGQRACPPGTRFIDSARLPSRATMSRSAACVDEIDRVHHGPYAEWQKDGSLFSVGWLERGVQHGRFQYFDSAGRLRARGFYRDGRIEGLWERFRESGKLFVSERYVLGVLDGPRMTVERDGSQRTVTYVRGELDGEVVSMHPDGRVALRGAYHRGTPDGTWQQYAADGRILGSFAVKNGTGPYREWHANGRLAVDGHYRHGERDGIWTYFDASGKRIGVYRVNDGDGPVREYYATGRTRLSGTLIGGKRDGVWTWWHADGAVIREVMYDKGTVLLTAIGRPIGRHAAD